MKVHVEPKDGRVLILSSADMMKTEKGIPLAA